MAAEHASRTPERNVSFRAEDGLQVDAADRLLRVALDNLIGNAWKFTRRVKEASVELGSAAHNGTRAYDVRANGVGFEAESEPGQGATFYFTLPAAWELE